MKKNSHAKNLTSNLLNKKSERKKNTKKVVEKKEENSEVRKAFFLSFINLWEAPNPVTKFPLKLFLNVWCRMKLHRLTCLVTFCFPKFDFNFSSHGVNYWSFCFLFSICFKSIRRVFICSKYRNSYHVCRHFFTTK